MLKTEFVTLIVNHAKKICENPPNPRHLRSILN